MLGVSFDIKTDEFITNVKNKNGQSSQKCVQMLHM